MKSLTAAAVAVLLSTCAYAQQAPGTDATTPCLKAGRPGMRGRSPRTCTTRPIPKIAVRPPSRAVTPFASRQFKARASGSLGNLWDKSVYNASGKSIGDLKDVLIDKDGKVTALVIGVGGFLGLGEKNVAVDYDYLQKNGGVTPSRITLGMSEEDLRNAPKFERSSSSNSR